MMPAQIIAQVIEEGGEIRLEDGRLKVKGIPARLIPAIREHKAALLALLSAPAHDDYATEESLAIQSEDEMSPDRGFDDIAGFEGVPDLTPSEHGAILHRLMYPPQESPAPALSTTDAAASPTMQPAPTMPRPEHVTCGSCVRFQPGTTKMGIGVCLATANGLPPAGRSGDYKAAYPNASRSCPEYAGSAS